MSTQMWIINCLNFIHHLGLWRSDGCKVSLANVLNRHHDMKRQDIQTFRRFFLHVYRRIARNKSNLLFTDLESKPHDKRSLDVKNTAVHISHLHHTPCDKGSGQRENQPNVFYLSFIFQWSGVNCSPFELFAAQYYVSICGTDEHHNYVRRFHIFLIYCIVSDMRISCCSWFHWK